MKLVVAALVLLGIGLAALLLLRLLDDRADRAEWARLVALQPRSPPHFTPELVAHLPEPARRWFAFAIRAGTPLYPVAEITMRGRFALGTKEDPRYRPMEARQILAAPEGFLWRMRTRGGMPLSGSDSARWTRFRLAGLIPVARAGGTPDHARSAFGRMVAEAAFWTPAALLPGPEVRFEPVDAETVRVTVRRGELEQAVEITVAADGRPERVVLQRWSDANPERRFRLQPFGGVASDFREVAGFRLPFRVEGGNMFGTEAWFPFFLAEVTEIRFPGAAP